MVPRDIVDVLADEDFSSNLFVSEGTESEAIACSRDCIIEQQVYERITKE